MMSTAKLWTAAFLALLVWVGSGYAETVYINEDFESPAVTGGYNKGVLPDSIDWVGASVGYRSGYWGLNNQDGGDFVAGPTNGQQGMSFRYTNSGITSGEGVIGELTLGATYTVIFDAVQDGGSLRGPGEGSGYNVQLVTFDPGAPRNDVRGNPSPLAKLQGNVDLDGQWDLGLTFSFTPDANNPTHAANLWKDLAVRLDGATDHAILDNVVVKDNTDSAVWDNDSADGQWETASNWGPDGVPTNLTRATIDNGDTVALTTAEQQAITLDLGATSTSTLNVSGGLNAVSRVSVGANGTLNVTGSLSSWGLRTSGNVMIDPAATLDIQVLEYNGGSLNLGGNSLNLQSLTANADLDLSGSSVASSNSVTVRNGILTLGNSLTTQTLTIENGIIAGGTVSAEAKYSFADVADYAADLTGAGAQLIIGEKRATDGTVKLSGTNNTYGGNTTIYRGVLEVNTDAANLGPGVLKFYSNNSTQPAILQTNGTFTRPIGNTTGGVYWQDRGGFAASGGALTVTLERGDGQIMPLDWGNKNNGFNGKYLQMGSPSATDVVTLTNDIDGGGSNRYIYVFGNPNSEADYAVLAGQLTNFNNLYVRGGSSPGKLQVTNVTANNVRVESGATLGCDGTITGNLIVNNGSAIAPGASLGTMTVAGNVTLNNGSAYEWEVGQPGQTDILHITSGTLNLDDFVLKILDADGYVASDTDPLPVFTYDPLLVTVDLGGFGNDADNFDTSALDGTWTIGTLELTDDQAGTIYLTGLSGGSPATGQPGDFNLDAQVEQTDLNLLLANWGASTVPPQWTAPFDGLVDQNELNDLLANWGAGLGGAEAVGAAETSVIPEPASLGLLGIGGLVLARRRRT